MSLPSSSTPLARTGISPGSTHGTRIGTRGSTPGRTRSWRTRPASAGGKFYWRGPGGTRAQLGDDGGCFEAALNAVETWGGVLEHPEGSLAWERFDLPMPDRPNQWKRGGRATGAGWSCLVDQGRYGHRARKRTLLYYVGLSWPGGIDLRPSLAPVLTTDKSARVGVEIMSKLERRLTPAEFATVLIALARYSTSGD